MTRICNNRKNTEQVLNIHEVLPESSVNGPGKRYVIWVQGCLKRCSGCCNPDTHDVGERCLVGVSDLLKDIQLRTDIIEGVTLSGGEPFLQAEAICVFLKLLRKNCPMLSVVLFSGYTLDEIRCIPHGRTCLRYIDVLVDGEYCASQATARIPASTNQKLHFLSTRYSMHDFDPVQETEMLINASGELYISGQPVSISMSMENA